MVLENNAAVYTAVPCATTNASSSALAKKHSLLVSILSVPPIIKAPRDQQSPVLFEDVEAFLLDHESEFLEPESSGSAVLSARTDINKIVCPNDSLSATSNHQLAEQLCSRNIADVPIMPLDRQASKRSLLDSADHEISKFIRIEADLDEFIGDICKPVSNTHVASDTGSTDNPIIISSDSDNLNVAATQPASTVALPSSFEAGAPSVKKCDLYTNTNLRTLLLGSSMRMASFHAHRSHQTIQYEIGKRIHTISQHRAAIDSSYSRFRSKAYTVDPYGHYSPRYRSMAFKKHVDIMEAGMLTQYPRRFDRSVDVYFSSPIVLIDGVEKDTDPNSSNVLMSSKIYNRDSPVVSRSFSNGEHIHEAIRKLDFLCQNYREQVSDGVISMLYQLCMASCNLQKCFIGIDCYGDINMFLESVVYNPESQEPRNQLVGIRGGAFNFLLAIARIEQQKYQRNRRLYQTDRLLFNRCLVFAKLPSESFFPEDCGCIKSLPPSKKNMQ